jgi:hypothetical protein
MKLVFILIISTTSLVVGQPPSFLKNFFSGGPLAQLKNFKTLCGDSPPEACICREYDEDEDNDIGNKNEHILDSLKIITVESAYRRSEPYTIYSLLTFLQYILCKTTRRV